MFMVEGFGGLECLGCLGLWCLGILGFRVFRVCVFQFIFVV